MTQNSDNVELYNFILSLDANVPIAGLITKPVLEAEVFAIEIRSADGNLPRYRLARHNFFHPEIKDLQRPALLVFLDEAGAKEYSAKSDQIRFTPISVQDLFEKVALSSRNSCGVMFRVNGNDYYANPQNVSDFNYYARLVGMTLVLDPNEINIVEDGELVLTLDQLQKIDDLLTDSPIVESYSIWRGHLDGMETTVIDIAVPDKLNFEDVKAGHANLLEACQAIVSDVTLIARPNLQHFDPPVADR